QAFANDRVRVLGNDDALPRAWVVHDARQVARGEALPLLASRAVDPRRTALLEVAPPPLAQPSNPATDSVAFDRYEPDRLRLTVQTEAAGLVVVSEVYDPGWHAYVDDERTPLYVADHVLRAVAVPAGTHTVEMRYEPRSLRVGIAISAVFAVAVLVVFGAAAWRANQRPAHLAPVLNTPARTPGQPGECRPRAVGTLWRRGSRRRPG
ncbi:MAG: YfhO family protein, partial [Thermomicrobiales bacterium]